ncbi:MAG: hypothetical protein M1821_001761 [Bathelium mastoideum]|nr:MAG: hypothetical protein M1821_001761 [Bathelium mastoideum]
MSRPSVQKKPSWVETPHNEHSLRRSYSSEAHRTVRITYTNPGTRPPVYVATSLTTPPWDPAEMEHEPLGEELEFYKEFANVKEGVHQYKFRLGPGDWWVLDENAPTVNDGNGNENNLLVIGADEEAVQHHRGDSTSEGTEPRTRVDSAVPTKAPDVPTLVVDKVDTRPAFGDDLGPAATEEQKVAHEARKADAEADEMNVRPHASEDRQTAANLHLSNAGGTHQDKSEEGRENVTSYSEDATVPEDADQDQKSESPMQENAPLFAHESMDGPSSGTGSEIADLVSNESANESLAARHPEFAASVGYNAKAEPVSPREEHPLFTHECASSQDDISEPKIWADRKRTGQRRRSALENAELVSDEEDDEDDEDDEGDEDEESLRRDPSVERFPDTREDIMMHLRRTESRLGHDDSDSVEGTPPSPLMKTGSPPLSRSRSESSQSITTPLNDIPEEPFAEDEEAKESGTEADQSSVPKGKDPESVNGSTYVEPITHSILKEITVHKKPAAHGEFDLKTTMPAVLSPPTPPMTPENTLKSIRSARITRDRLEEHGEEADAPENLADRPGLMADVGFTNLAKEPIKPSIPSTPVISGTLRQRRPDSDGTNDANQQTQSSSQATDSSPNSRPATDSTNGTLMQKETHEGMLHAVWRVLFGNWLNPLGHWLARLCGGRRNAAGAAVFGLVVTWVTGYYFHTGDILALLNRRELD